MGVTRKLAVLCVVALAGVALSASTAAAQETGVQLVLEGSGEPCDPCQVHFEGSSTITTHLLGMETQLSACTDEFEAEVFESGSGQVLGYSSTTAAGCNQRLCNGVGEPASEVEWPIASVGETATNVTHHTIELCFDGKGNPNATGLHCTAEVNLHESAFEEHLYELLATDEPCQGTTELDGRWESETSPGHDEIEVVHL